MDDIGFLQYTFCKPVSWNRKQRALNVATRYTRKLKTSVGRPSSEAYNDSWGYQEYIHLRAVI